MPIVMLVAPNQVNEPYNYLNDIIGVFPDEHPFTDNELAEFAFLDIAIGINTQDEVQAKLDSIRFIETLAFLWESDQKWHRDPEIDGQGQEIPYLAELPIWTSGEPPGNLRWYKLLDPWKFPFNIAGLTQGEKDTLAVIDVNHPSVDAFIRKIRREISSRSVNTSEEIRELRGTTP